MPSQSHKCGRLVTVSVRARVPPDAIARAVQTWLLTAVHPARYLVAAYMNEEEEAACDACFVVEKPKRADNVRTSLRAALWSLVAPGRTEVDVESDGSATSARVRSEASTHTRSEASAHVRSEASVRVRSVRVHGDHNNVRCAAELLQSALRQEGAVTRLEGWDETELRSPAAVSAVVPHALPRFRWVPRARAQSVLTVYVRPRDVFQASVHEMPHSGTEWALCPPSVACDACQAFSNAVYDSMPSIDMSSVLRAALTDGWDVSALYEARTKAALGEALADWFRVTYLRPPLPSSAESSAPRSAPKRRRYQPPDDEY